MKTFKLIDFWGQVSLIAASLLSLMWRPDIVFLGYFVVGGWQVVSCLLHVSMPGGYLAVHDRKYYNRTLIWLLAIGILSIPFWLLYGFCLLIISPFLAIWYASICYAENKLIEHRSLVHLK